MRDSRPYAEQFFPPPSFLTIVQHQTYFRRVDDYSSSNRTIVSEAGATERRNRARAVARHRSDVLKHTGKADALLTSLISPMAISLSDLQRILDEDLTEG